MDSLRNRTVDPPTSVPPKARGGDEFLIYQELNSKMAPLKITKIEIRRIQWEIKDCGPSKYSTWVTYNPGASLHMGSFMTSIYTDQGVVGSYPIGHDLSSIARALLGRNPLAREEIYNDFNQFHRGGIHVPIQGS